MTWKRRIAIVLGALAVGVLASGGIAFAHPLGNFTVNRYDGIVVTTDEIRIHHVVDLAEIPTVQASTTIDSDHDSVLSTTELATYADIACDNAVKGLTLSIGEHSSTLSVDATAAATREGQAGLSTLRLECDLSSPVRIGEAASALSFTDDAETAEVGWREVTLAGDRVTLSGSTVPTESVSNELLAYPQDLLSSPLDVKTATAQLTAGGPPLPSDVSTSTTASTSSSQPTGFGSQLLTDVTNSAAGPVGMTVALLLSVVVGAAHALAPGHGKSLVAFALAGRRQRGARSAAVVGATVTGTHTGSVLVLGLLIATTSHVVAASVYPMLGLVSGALILILGVGLVRSAVRGTHGHHGHAHPHSHERSHHHDSGQPHAHSHDSHHAGAVLTLTHDSETEPHTHDAEPSHRRGMLVSLGIVGGLLPSPTAVVVLLATVAAGKAWFGVMLVLGFGLGMALTLGAVAFLVLHAQDRMLRRLDVSAHSRVAIVMQRLPLATAAAVCVVGVLLVARSWPGS